jgi:hypothetical protein
MQRGARYHRRAVALTRNSDFGRESCDFQVSPTVRLSGEVEKKIDANSSSLGVIHNPAPYSVGFGHNVGKGVVDRLDIQRVILIYR